MFAAHRQERPIIMAIISPEIGAFYLGNTIPELTDELNPNTPEFDIYHDILEGTTWSVDGVGTDFTVSESEFQYQGQQLVNNPNYPVNVWDEDTEGFGSANFDSWVVHNQADGTPGTQLNVIHGTRSPLNRWSAGLHERSERPADRQLRDQ